MIKYSNTQFECVSNITVTQYILREAAKKLSFFSGTATKVFPPPPSSSLVATKNFQNFFRASKNGLFI